MFKTIQFPRLEPGNLALLACFGASSLFLVSSTDPSSAACPPGVQWKQIGPSPLAGAPFDLGNDSGMVRDIAIDPSGTSDQTIYIATDNGGIWKTTDRGATWSPKTDFMPSLSMGSVALDPGNPSIVYAGTGNFQNAGFFKGVGIYKSTNGGDSWTVPAGNSALTNQPANYSTLINRIVLPAPGVLLIGTYTWCQTCNPGIQGGAVFKSVDGGGHFGNNNPNFDNGQPVFTGAIGDVAIDTANSSIVYASVTGLGVYESSDQGTTFSVNLFKPRNGAFIADDGSATTIGYIAFAQSTQPNNQTMYANVQLTSGGPQMSCAYDGQNHPGSSAMLKSINGGANWSYVTLTGEIRCSYQVGYDQTIGVDPQDANRVYLGMRALYMATDGGAAGLGDANRIDLNKVHADQHALKFSPASHRTGQPTRLYNGTDGGISTNPDGGINNWTLLNGSTDCAGPDTALATILFRQIDIGRGSTANNVYTFGAAQDNALSSHQRNCPGTVWHYGRGGDAGTVAVDPRDPTHAIADENGSFRQATSGGDFGTTGGAGLPSPLVLVSFDPNGGVAYAATGGGAPQNANTLFQSTDNGATFTAIHPFPAGITAIGMAAIDSSTMWVGLADGTVQRTRNVVAGTSTWVPHSILNSPGGQFVSGIAVDPANTDQAVVVYPVPGVSPRAFLTANDGSSWTDISGNLPNLPLRAVVIDPNTSPHSIIVATDAGVMRTVNQGTSWDVLGVGLPNVQCTSLALDSTAIPSLLRVGTYGRSAFELAYDRKYVSVVCFPPFLFGTRELPFCTVTQAVNAPPTGDAKVIIIQSGDYHETPPSLTISQCCTLMAINGSVTIH